MAGLIALFSRHSGIWTNFSIFMMESRPILPERAIRECEEPRCAERPGGPRSALVDADTRAGLVVGPWQYQCSGPAAGWASTRYTTLPVLPSSHYPGYYPPHRTLPRTSLACTETAPTRTLGRSKEILGVDNAQCSMGYRSVLAMLTLRTVPPPLWAGLWDPAVSMRTGLA